MTTHQQKQDSDHHVHGSPRAHACKGTIAALAAFISLTSSSVSADDAMRGFVKCLQMQDDQARLACYDRLATEVVELGLPADGAAAAAAAAPQATTARQAPAPAPEQEFGLQERADVESITARVVGGFQGWDGKTRFELDNGQVWEQSAPGRFGYRGPDRAVVIRRGMLNSFLLSPEGLNRNVRVLRVE